MKVLIAGGTGFLGRHLARSLLVDHHQVWVLSRDPGRSIPGVDLLRWDGKALHGWEDIFNDVDAVVNYSGLSLNTWPWTEKRKQQFHDSRVQPGLALAGAIERATRKPSVFVQISGINHYGLHGVDIANESSPPGSDYLAQLTVAWENSTSSIEGLGVRRVVCRTAVVLARDAILFRLMALPVRLYFGGPYGHGRQALPWIHLEDHVSAIRFLMDHSSAEGAFNLIAPQPTSNADFMRALAEAYHRPYWFPIPPFLLRIVLGEMSVLITAGRFAEPRSLLDLGFPFRFPGLAEAFQDLVK